MAMNEMLGRAVDATQSLTEMLNHPNPPFDPKDGKVIRFKSFLAPRPSTPITTDSSRLDEDEGKG
jgi:hypothetical protein